MKELDFLPESFHQARRRSRLMRRNALYSLALAAAFASVHAINASHLRSARAGLARLRTDARATALHRRRLQALHASRHTLADRLHLVTRLDDDAPLDLVLAEVAAHMNDAIAIRSLQVKTLPPHLHRSRRLSATPSAGLPRQERTDPSFPGALPSRARRRKTRVHAQGLRLASPVGRNLSPQP